MRGRGRRAELRRIFVVAGVAAGALFAFIPFTARLLLHLAFGGRTRRRIRDLLADERPVAVDEPPPVPPELRGTVYIVAGEDSGDLHAANLATAIRRLAPGVRVRGMGGPRMAAAGVELDYDLVRMNVMGVWPVVKAFGTFFGLFRKLLRILETDPPDVFVPVDYPGFNLRVARLARRRGVKVVAYIAPQVWAWAPWRVGRIRRSVDRILAILPFERDLFRRRGGDCAYVGHPLAEHLAATVPPREAAPPGPPRIGLLPGSRVGEVEALLPVMLEAARLIQERCPEAEFVLPCARERLRPVVSRILAEPGGGPPVEVVLGRTAETMRDLTAAFVASGTATLELGFYQTPMVVMYRVGRWTALLARLLLLVRNVGLVNLVAGREIVPEEVGRLDPARAAACVGGWLADPAAAEVVRRDLALVRARLATAGASDRAAGHVLSFIPRGGAVPPPA